jgi:hypothetical protein
MTGAAGPVITGCAVGDDLANALGDTNEAQFAAALNFAETGSCSSNASAKPQPTSSLKSEPAVTFAEADKLLEHPRLKSFDLEFGDLDLTSPRK